MFRPIIEKSFEIDVIDQKSKKSRKSKISIEK